METSVYVIVLLASITCDGRMLVSPPSRYVSLSGDLEIPYVVTTAAEDDRRVEAALVDVGTNVTVASVNFRPVANGDRRGKLLFRCGSILHAGKCKLNIITIGKVNGTVDKIKEEDDKEGRPVTISIEWPSFTLTAPRQVETYTTDVTVSVESTGIACHPLVNRETWLELEFTGTNGDRTTEPSRQYVQSAQDFYRITSRDIAIRCSHLEQAGYYRIVLRSAAAIAKDGGSAVEHDVGNVVASRTVRVVWSEEYRLRPPPFVLPCVSSDDRVSVAYDHPPCILNRDRIRVYGRPKRTSSAAVGALLFQYVFERRVSRDEPSGTAEFPCRLFNDSYVEYCFKYVSVARRGVVSEVRSTCVPTYDRHTASETAVDGGWSEWSSWSGCSATCGHGTRIRHRFCDSPSPSSNGLFCDGRVTDADECHSGLSCTDGAVGSEQAAPVIDEYKMSERCQCGCGLNVSSLRPIYIASSARRCSRTSTWILTGVDPGAALHFTFLHFDLNDTTECLQVRDGSRSSSELLLHETGRKIPSSVTSSSRLALLRYHPTENQRNGSGAGFVTRIELTNPDLGSLVLNVDATAQLQGSPMIHLTATVFCSVLLLVSLGLAVHHFVDLRKQRRAAAAALAAAEESLLSSPFGSSLQIDVDEHHCRHTHGEPSTLLAQAVLTSTTSVSDLSIEKRQQQQCVIIRTRKQRRKRRNDTYRTCATGGKRSSRQRRPCQLQSPIESVGSEDAAYCSSNSSSSSSTDFSPEDYLRDSRLFHSSTSPITSPGSPPLFFPIYKLPPLSPARDSSSRSCTATAAVQPMPLKLSPLTPGMTRKLPVATVTPQPARIVSTKTYCAEKLKKLQECKEPTGKPTAVVDGGLPVSNGGGVGDRSHANGDASSIEQADRRPSAGGANQSARMMASVSEVSLADAEFEYDYYDYGVHHETPGSYFTHFSVEAATSWLPPYASRPPSYSDDDHRHHHHHHHHHQNPEEDGVYPLHDFRSRSSRGRAANGDVNGIATDVEDDGQNSLIVQESSADSDAMTASATSDRIPDSRSASDIGIHASLSTNGPNSADSRPTKSAGLHGMFG